MAGDAPMVEVCPLSPAVGEVLDGKYEIVKEIRRTSTGVVYEAVEGGRGRRVAVKTLLESSSGDGQLAARFRREARAAGAIGDPHLPRVFDLGRTAKGLCYLVTELFAGETLAAALARTPRLPVPRALGLIGEVLAGLAAAHKAGLVHRDLNPECVLLPEDKAQPEFVKLLDFGISRIVGSSGPRTGPARPPGAAASVLYGTPAYLSPELVRGLTAVADQRTDVYSAGVLLYQMLCGRTPFEGDDLPQLLRDILGGTCPRPTSLRPEIPPAVEAVILRALEREPRKRYSTALAMRAELTSGTASSPGLADSGQAACPPAPVAPPPSATATAVGPPPVPASPAAPPRLPPPSPSLARPMAPERAEAAPGPAPAPAASSSSEAAPAPSGLATVSRHTPPGRPAVEALPGLAMDARSMALARDRGARVQALIGGRRRFPWWALAAGLALLVMVLVLVLGLRSPPPVPAPVVSAPVPEVLQRYFLRISPASANVTLDHVPVSTRELPVDSGPPRAHVLKVAAPGHVTRSLTFTASPGMELIVRLGHTLPAPEPSDPPPLPAEMAAEEPDSPRPATDIERAFALLGRYAACLTATARLNEEAKRGATAAFVESEAFAPCRKLAELKTAEPRFLSLSPAAEAYVAAARKGVKPETLARMAARLRAEYLAERALWQWHELASIGRDEGRKVAWHMRRVALGAHAWVRSGGAGPSNRRLADARAARLLASAQALADHVASDKEGVGGIRGGDDFLRSAQEMALLARAGKRPNDGAVLAACRKLLTDFDALVFDR